MGSFPLNSKNNNISQFSIILNNEASVLDSLSDFSHGTQEYHGLCTYNLKYYSSLLLFLRNFDWEGHHTYFTVTCVHDSEMLAEINSMEVWMTSLHISSPTLISHLLMFRASYNQFSGNLMGLNGSGAFQTAVSLEVL